ncbi:hypothetical protein CONLIGDRAFT_691751 [Coniochaeta ligniaria NRRL 30616]|uniref:Uncharacterized protein n=1 Tax=Coniochaeta ligniaria NRRL 30616 TaxID=1408157 RepID=A0A1J7J3N0_9PEZI|nr:hypothetical protein CONLIGDRAFT_691751 [Coniochaeta ligniaria NRRL 30616]
MARVLASCVRKVPSLRETYPALKHIRLPTDPELHFRAWYTGGTNLLYICLCAERSLRMYHRSYDMLRFADYREEIGESVYIRAGLMAAGTPGPSTLLGPLWLRWPDDPENLTDDDLDLFAIPLEDRAAEVEIPLSADSERGYDSVVEEGSSSGTAHAQSEAGSTSETEALGPQDIKSEPESPDDDHVSPAGQGSSAGSGNISINFQRVDTWDLYH